MTILVSVLLLLLSWPRPAWALQTHGGYEGLYVHQGAHLLFILAMISFAYRLRVTKLTAQKSWRWMYRGAVMISIWNIWAFIGHFIALTVSGSVTFALGNEVIPVLRMTSWRETAYFFLKMDHLLSLPAVIFFYLGLKDMHRTFPQRDLFRDRRRHERRRVDRRLL
ncbi:MAG: hypothetical protein P8Y63_08960 [Deltaproteobacteria bacterium]|jgi:hypothetical protein